MTVGSRASGDGLGIRQALPYDVDNTTADTPHAALKCGSLSNKRLERYAVVAAPTTVDPNRVVQQPSGIEMITTLPSDRIHRPPGMSPEGEYHWASAMLPPATGAFLIDLDWSETSFKRTQSLLCPATTDAVSGMHVHEIAILDIMYIPSPQHDGTGREPVLRVNAIDRALVPERGFVEVLLVRTLDGNWHACDRHVNLDTLED
jgi:hypothetical protein